MTTSSNSTYNNGNEHTKHKTMDRSIVKEYKTKYPITFAELKLDGFSDADAVKYIRNNVEFNNDYDTKNMETASSLTFMKQLRFD